MRYYKKGLNESFSILRSEDYLQLSTLIGEYIENRIYNVKSKMFDEIANQGGEKRDVQNCTIFHRKFLHPIVQQNLSQSSENYIITYTGLTLYYMMTHKGHKMPDDIWPSWLSKDFFIIVFSDTCAYQTTTYATTNKNKDLIEGYVCITTTNMQSLYADISHEMTHLYVAYITSIINHMSMQELHPYIKAYGEFSKQVYITKEYRAIYRQIEHNTNYDVFKKMMMTSMYYADYNECMAYTLSFVGQVVSDIFMNETLLDNVRNRDVDDIGFSDVILNIGYMTSIYKIYDTLCRCWVKIANALENDASPICTLYDKFSGDFPSLLGVFYKVNFQKQEIGELSLRSTQIAFAKEMCKRYHTMLDTMNIILGHIGSIVDKIDVSDDEDGNRSVNYNIDDLLDIMKKCQLNIDTIDIVKQKAVENEDIVDAFMENGKEILGNIIQRIKSER